MKSIIKIAVLSIVLVLSNLNGFSQRNKDKRGKGECPTHTEDLQSKLPQYDMPTFDDTLSTADTSKMILKDDKAKVDSVESILVDYYEKKNKTAGWRIQIWTGQKESGMKVISNKYDEFYLDLDLYVHEKWDGTFFRVKIGDFTDRLDAYRYLIKIKEEFPTALLVPDQVDLNKI